MSSSSTELLSGIVREIVNENGFTVERYSLSGEPHANAIVNAVTETYERPGTIDWESLVGKPITFLRETQGMVGAVSIYAEEAKIFKGQSGNLAFLPKGKRSKGFRLDPDKILDVVEGYGGTSLLRTRVEAAQAQLPTLRPLTKERLLELPRSSQTCSMAVMGNWGIDAKTYTAIWFLSEYDPDDDIVDGVLCVHPLTGTSEHGSVYGRDLLRVGGEIVDFEPITYKEAIDRTNWEHFEVLADVVRRQRGTK
jgi:hypothetical protein